MTDVVPAPSADDIPVNEPVTVDIGAGQQATVTYTARQRTNEGFVLPTVAVSKRSQSSYEISADDEQIYGPAGIPPTDIDDLAVCFVPAYEFEQELEVQVTNLSDTSREYHIQPMGYERVGGGE
ncbi:hypothetical protein [Halorubrum sp. Boch-26]|uniref:hypothetical protein n=1 Tax=Halorubrum sp. Boch-26 TaxID=2994426 RepID=UPI002469A687|nr:hypothetical protein [Halorubrum sp. Boch-26]